MKLHLPIGLRKALMAVLAVLPTAAAVSSFAASTATAGVDDSTIDGIIATWVNNYNKDAADKGEALIYSKKYSTEYTTTSSYNGSITLPAGTVTKDDVNIGTALDYVSYLPGFSYGVRNEATTGTFSGTSDIGTDNADYTQFHISGSGVNLALAGENAIEVTSGQSLKLIGSSWLIKESTSTLTSDPVDVTYTGNVEGKVNVDYQYTKLSWTGSTIEKGSYSLSYNKNNYSYTNSETLTYVKDVYVNYGLINYELTGGQKLEHDSSISMADDAANSIVIGSAVPENGVASDETKAVLGATSMDLNANSIVVQGGSYVYASEGALKLGGDSVSVLDGSGLMAQEVIVNADGAVSFAGGSGINVGTVDVKGKTISLSGAQFYATGLPTAPDLTDDDARALDVVDADVKLHATGALTISDNTNINANLVDVNSASGVVTVTNSSIQGLVGVNVGAYGVNNDGKSLELSNATVLGSDVEMNATGAINITSGSLILTADDKDYRTSETISLISTEGSVSVTGSSIGKDVSDVTKTANKITLNGTSVLLNSANLYAGNVELTATNGDVTLSSNSQISQAASATLTGKNVSIIGSSANTGNSSVGAQSVKLDADEKIVLSSKGSITSWGTSADQNVELLAGTEIKLEGGASIMSNKGSVIMDSDGSILVTGSGTSVTARSHDISLQSNVSNAIANNASVHAAGKLSMEAGKLGLVAGSNTIDNSIVNAGNGISMNAQPAVDLMGLLDFIANGGDIMNVVSGGSNMISGSEVNAGMNLGADVSMTGLTNTIDKSTVLANGGQLTMAGVEIDRVGKIGFNTISGSSMRFGGGVSLTGTTNTIDTSNIHSGAGFVVDSLWNDIKGETNIQAVTGATLGTAGNTVFNNIGEGAGVKAFTGDITMDAMVNNVSGMLNSQSGSLTLTGTKVTESDLLGTVIESLAGANKELAESLINLGLVTKNADGSYDVNLDLTANSLSGENAKLSAADTVKLKAMLNLLMGGTVEAGKGVTLDGGINVVTDTAVTATTGNINLTATAESNALVSTLANLLANNAQDWGIDAEIMAEIEPVLEILSGSANAIIDGSLNAEDGAVALSATANLMTDGSISAKNGVTFDGAINAVTGGTITGGSVDFFASEENTLDLSEVLGSLSDLLGGDEGQEGGSTDGEGQTNWTDLIGKLGEKLTGNTNLVIGGEVKATSDDVTMDGTLNVLAGGTVSAEQGTVQLTGLANVLVGGTVNNSNAAELNGSINAVLSGTLEGGSVTMNGAKEGLNLGEMLVPVLEAAGVDASITGLVGELGTIDGNINLVTGGTVNATSGDATLNGTLNLLTGGSVHANKTATLNGAANVLVGGELSGANVVMQQGETGINLGGVIKPLLESAGVGAEITDLVGSLGEINGNINVVTGTAKVNGTNTVKMDSLANVVVGEDAEVTGGKITMTGTQSIDLPLGTIVNGLVSQYVELPDAVVDVLGSLDGEIGLNTNVVTNGGTVSATEQAKLNASVNYVGNGGSVSGDKLVELTGPMNLVLSNGSLTSENGTVRLNGYGPSLNQMGVQIPAEYAGYVEQLGLSGLLNKQFGVNLVMGENATVSGNAIEMNAGLMNMVADRAQLTADKNMSLSGATNIVVDGSTLTAENGTLSMSGSLNLVSHLVLNDFVNAIQNGTPLPTEGALTTLSGQNVQLWGAANVLHGNVLVTATGDVVMAGMGEPLFELSSMTVQQVVDLARELGVPALLDEAKTEVLNALMDYAAENNMSDLVEAAADLGLQDQLSGIYSDLKDFVKENGDAALNLSLNGNVNTVSGGAMVNGNNVSMNGTINYVGDLASVTGNTVKIDGITNVVAGGAEVTGGDITLSGGVNVLVDTTLDNVKDAIANGNLDSIVAGGKDLTTVSGENVTLNAKANLVNGYVAVEADDAVTMQGITNVVSGGATVNGEGSVNMDAAVNVIAGGATVTGGDINMTGGMNAVVDTTLGNVVDALQQQSLAPLMQGGSEVTKLSATGDINLGAALNVVNGGKVVLEAGEAVNMTGAVNVLGSKTTVNATDINMAGIEIPELDLSGILPAEYAELAEQYGLTEMFEEGLNANIVAGGAKLNAENDITLSGAASAVVDTNMTNVLDALKQQSIDPLLQGGTVETVLTAGNNINLISKVNVVNGGKVTLDAGNDVTMAGVLNVVNGNSVVKAGNAITMDGAANLVSGGAALSADSVSISGNEALSDEFAALVETVIPGIDLPAGVSAGVVMGNGTTVKATDSVEMLNHVNVVADGAQISAETAKLAGTMNAVTGAAGVSADKVEMLGSIGNLVLDGATVAAEGNATMTGAANVVQGATVTAENNINMEALGAVSNGLSEVVNTLLPDSETAERVNKLLAQGNANAVVDGAQLNADGNVSMKAAANVVDNATVSAGGNVAMSSSVLHTINNSTIQSVSGNVSISGGIATVTGSTVTAEQGRINFSDVNIAMSGGSMYAADGMTVSNNADAALSNVTLGGESFIESGSSLNISNLESMGDIENFGSLTLENAVLSGATMYNAGSVMVSNKLTLDSATLSFVADSLTMNSTAIVLGDGFDTIIDGPGAGDMLAGLSFALNYDALEFRNGSDSVFDFKLAIFEGITADQTSLLAAALQDGEFSITLSNGFLVDVNEDLSIVWENNVAYATGSASVPEPTTATLSLLALAALAARRRRK